MRAIAMCLILAMAWSSASGYEYVVGPDGDDGNPGSAARPFATLQRAQRAVRELAARGDEPIRVMVKNGVYYLDEPLVFGPEDSGTESAPVVYRAEQEGGAVISGGMRLTLNWKLYREGIMQAQVPAVLSQTDKFEIDQLFVNGQRQPMARYPNYDPEARPYNGAAADAFSPERAARWSDPTGGYIHAMHRAHWGGYHYRITGKNAQNEVSYEGGWQNNRQMGMHPKDRFVENIFEELDAPGEWYYNARTGTLYYWPAPGQEIASATFEVVRLRHLVEFRGSLDRPVHHITLTGFVFRHAARTFMDTREPLLRSDWTIYRGGGVLLDGAEDCIISDCEFDQLGGNAVFVSNYNRRIIVRGCHIHGCGASGVCFVGNPDSVRNPLFEYNQRQRYDEIDLRPGPQTDHYPADCQVDDCLIHNVSVMEKQATGVQISMSSRITVRHCSIYDVGRAGINISEGTFGGHLIDSCDVFDTVRETGDHGSFNSWGRDRFWGLKDAPADELAGLALLDVATNTIRNSRWRCDHGWDVDLDDGSSNYEIYNNVFLHGGLKLREGFHRRVWNNIGINCSLHAHVWYPQSMDILNRNIWTEAYPNPISMPKGKWGIQNDYNLFTSETALKKAQQYGWDSHSVVGDPGFINPAKGDYRVQKDSPALKLGFQNFAMDQFGVMKPALRALARTPELPRLRWQESQALEHEDGPAFYWQGASVEAITGEAFSAFGVNKEDGGVHLKEVPSGLFAARCGFQKGDLIQAVNGQAVKTVMELYAATNRAAGRSLQINYVRGQQSRALAMDRYIYVTMLNFDDKENKEMADILSVADTLPFKAVKSTPDTANEPLSVLSDGRLARNYGPVFRNGVESGVYEIDLGHEVEMKQISTWSFNQNGNRGRQCFSLFGVDPGNSSTPGTKRIRIPLATVETAGYSDGLFTVSRIKTSDGSSLGCYRWLEWNVSPVTEAQENTAYQEFQVK